MQEAPKGACLGLLPSIFPDLVLAVREKPCLGLLLGWDKLGGPLQVAVLTGSPEMALSILASGQGQA